ncbi:MAG TPA: ABC transporter permease [bacterium]|nr:ABC transporter permease [bacterium]
MSLSNLLRIAWQALRRNITRSILTMLGIIIGVGAVITSMAIGAGAQAAVLAQIESLGANLLVVIPGAITTGGVNLGSGSRTTLTLPDVTAIAQTVPEVAGAAPYSQTSAQVVAGGTNWYTVVGGTTPSYTTVRSWAVAQGRFFAQADVDQATKVAVLGATVAQNLFPSGGAVGATVVVKNVPFKVVGVLAAKGQSGFGRDQDDVVMVPMTTLQARLTGQTWVNNIFVSATTPEAVPLVVDATERLLRLRHHLTVSQPDDFSVRNIADIQQVRIATSQTQALLLAGIAVVSLVVGGIGIMNIMLVSVTERTREIGLRMAVGARGRDILLQFLVEALTLACVGGLIGIGMGLLTAQGTSVLGHWPVLVSGFSIVLGFVSSLVVGVVFGFYPAQRAAALDPIVALRYE